MMDAALSLLSDHGVQAYFLILGIAIHRCVKIYYGGSASKSTSSSSILPSTSIVPLFLSLLIISITWYLIINFILINMYTSSSYFDDAYKDVLRTNGHYFTSSQLLTWAIVAVVWCAVNECDLSFIIFGFLGAMSASFVLWVPTLYNTFAGTRTRNKRYHYDQVISSVPITFVVTSIIAFVSILKLQPCTSKMEAQQQCTQEEGFGTFLINFRQWLQCLHVILVVPIFIPYLLPSSVNDILPRVHSSIVFGTLSVTFAIWHLYQMISSAKLEMEQEDGSCDGSSSILLYTMPNTDCQISITTDLVCCSLITLYAIYKDYYSSMRGDTVGALTRMFGAAIVMPIISPAAVLAGHLCLIRLDAFHSLVIAYVQRTVAFKLSSASENDKDGNQSRTMKWCNLGLWEDDNDKYEKACENLANALGKVAVLHSSDAVLSCGCGSSLDEVRYYKQTFGLRHITGIDRSLSEGRMTDENDYNVRAIRASVEDLKDNDEGTPLFPRRLFNKIICLDNIYHYASKESFLRDCYAMLPNGGQVAVSDIVLKNDIGSTPQWIKIVLQLCGIPTRNLWCVEEYHEKLVSLGYGKDDIQIHHVGGNVFKGWQRFLPQSLLNHLDYALIVAKKPMDRTQLKKKKKIAIIGSGLAGLSTAHSLLSSQEAADLDVDIYEANGCLGLAGNTTLVGRQLVDVPARMACLGYYNEYGHLLEELDIPYSIVRTDSSFYGDDGQGSSVCYSYGQNSFVNIYNALFVGGPRNLWQMIKALGNLQCGDNDVKSYTFGEWMEVNLGICNITSTEKQHDIPSLTCYSNPFAYIMCGSLSWMLSCTWTDLLKYPADIVLPYCQGLKMDKLGVGRQGQVIRVVPSIKVLERTLLYGLKNIHLNKRVAAIDDKRLINGIAYDAVIIATEAKAVPKVMKNCSDAFGKIVYHPSIIYIHTDDSFMPDKKKDWKCWNVEMSSGRQEPQLTFWLNEFYPDARFDKDIFQTWAPVAPPKKDTIITRCDFERVVHSSEARAYIDDINKEQGKGSIYYAGSYCVYGMGLLEQALISGKEAAKKVIEDISSSHSPPTAVSAPPLKALVVGAGPSGLVTAKYLLESTEPTYQVTILESSKYIGGSFVNKVYDNCRLVSSKYLTAFSEFRMQEATADHPSAAEYVSYLESYADQFGLKRCIQFRCHVTSVKDANQSIKEGDSSGYEVQYTNPDSQIIKTEKFDVVAICSGLHNTPCIPDLFLPSSPADTKTGIFHKFKGQIIHSSEYKDSSLFTGKRVLIVGCGETAMDLAHRAILNPQCKIVAMSVRRGFLSIPHSLAKNRPLDVFITNLFEHAYEHPWVHALRLRWHLSTIFIRLFLFLTGSSWGFNQWAVPTTPVRRGYHIINKSHAAMSHLNVPMKRQYLWGQLWMWVYGESHLRPIQSFYGTQVAGIDDDGTSIRFTDGRRFEADLIVLATGYQQSFPFLHNSIRKEIQKDSLRSNPHTCTKDDTSSYILEEDYLPSDHFIVSRTRPTLGFIGFVRPNVGAIPPMSELQVMWWLEHMRGRVKKLAKSGPPSYMLLGKKYRYGVDYGNYMHRIAEDFDAAPTLTTLARSRHPFRALYTYCIGQSMVPLFRLQGPFESKTCWEVVTGELWRVCLRRGIAENCGLLYMTMLSLLMNVVACALECIWCLVTLRRPKFFVRY